MNEATETLEYPQGVGAGLFTRYEDVPFELTVETPAEAQETPSAAEHEGSDCD